MVVHSSSRGRRRKGRTVTPMRAAASAITNFRTHGSGRGRRGRQIPKLKVFGCDKDRSVSAGRHGLTSRVLNRPGAEDQRPSVSPVSSDTSVTMPSGVSSFLLDCLDVESPASDADGTLSSIEEFRRADSYDEVTACAMSRVRNSTLLDGSDAQGLELQQTPNLSSILELSLDPDEKREESFTLSPIRLSPVRVSSETPGRVWRSAGERTAVDVRDEPLPPDVMKCFAEKEKSMKCRKVTFSDIVSVRDVSSHTCVKSGSVSADSRTPVRFFHFTNDCERRTFFWRLKQRCSFQFPAKPIVFT